MLSIGGGKKMIEKNEKRKRRNLKLKRILYPNNII